MSTRIGSQMSLSMKTSPALVPFFSFQNTPTGLRNEWRFRIAEVIDRGIFIRGPESLEFENSWSKYLGNKYSLGVSNGQDALILALRALGVVADDLVVLPAHSFIATHNAILALGAVPTSVDVGIDGLIDPSHLETLSKKPKVLIVVHMHGKMCEMDRIMEWARSNEVKVIEDCSQAHGASQKGSKSGTFGDINIFSLYPTKNLGALGDAGIITTNFEHYYKLLASLSNYGSAEGNKYLHTMFGLNNRLDEIQAAVLNVNFKYLDEWNCRRNEIAQLYLKAFEKSSVTILQDDSTENVRHHFCILHPRRDSLKSHLFDSGVMTDIHYPNVAAHESETFTGQPLGYYPRSSMIAERTLSLPISPWHTNEQINYVIEKVLKFV